MNYSPVMERSQGLVNVTLSVSYGDPIVAAWLRQEPASEHDCHRPLAITRAGRRGIFRTKRRTPHPPNVRVMFLQSIDA